VTAGCRSVEREGGGAGEDGGGVRTVSANLGRLRGGQAVEHWAEQGIFPMLTQIGLIPAPGAGAVPGPRASASDTAVRPAMS
jgi:hypothetical protein